MRTGIANRHLLPVDSLGTPDRPLDEAIRIVVPERWARSRAGQHLTSCLVNLLCRQIDIVGHVEIVSPHSTALIRLPNGHSATDFQSLLSIIPKWAVDGSVTVTAKPTKLIPNTTVFIGDVSQEDLVKTSGCALLAVADGWRAWIGDPSKKHFSVDPMSGNPLGPFLAAALVSGEIFKRARGILRGRYLTESGYSLWTGAGAPDWKDLADGPSVERCALPPIHVAGAGAVSNAFAYIVQNLGLASGYFAFIDDDTYDDTNLNRCLLAGLPDLGHSKVEAICRSLEAAGVDCYGFPGTIRSYVSDSRIGLRPDVARDANDLVFRVLISCVDKGTSRHDVQGLRPQLLLGGSTLDLQAKSNIYTGRPGTACLACFNPSERDGDRLRMLERQLRGMTRENRSAFLTQHDLDLQAVEDYLSGAQCGGLGESSLRDFALRPNREFSVGFVSLGAGLLLAAKLLQRTALCSVAETRGDLTTLNFLNGGLLDAWSPPDDNCELNCQTRCGTIQLKG